MLSFHIKFVQTDRRTTEKQYTPDLSMLGHKNAGTKTHFNLAHNINSVLTDDTRSFCGQSISRSDCTEHAV